MPTGGEEGDFERRRNHPNTWDLETFDAPLKKPAVCCAATLCGPCVSYYVRKRFLYGDMSKYVCCGGFMPCSGYCCEKQAPDLCLFLEACLCFSTSVATSRFLIQDDLRIANTECDNCLIATMLFLNQLACICQLAACLTGDEGLQDLADAISFISDCVWCSACACFQSQHVHQLDIRDGVVQPNHTKDDGYGAATKAPLIQEPMKK